MMWNCRKDGSAIGCGHNKTPILQANPWQCRWLNRSI
jgi:hypothetical protein